MKTEMLLLNISSPGASSYNPSTAVTARFMRIPEAEEITILRTARIALPTPTLLVELDPRHKIFFRNLVDLFRIDERPPASVSSRPGAFWPDVFVSSRLPWKRFLESAFCHTAAIFAILGLGQWWPQPPRVIEQPVFRKSDVIYYSSAEYLLPVNTGVAASGAHAGDPEYAVQSIISVPPEPDNNSQTIVTPPDAKLKQDVPLPNIVAWPAVQPAAPLAATVGAKVEMNLPALPASVVAPAPNLTSALSARTMPVPSAAMIPPAPRVETTSVRRLGDVTIGHSVVIVPAPQLPVAEQRALTASAQAEFNGAASQVVPPPPSLGGGVASHGDGRIIALGIHPSLLSARIAVPEGNRRGTFAATPAGKPGATGTPNIAADNTSGKGDGGRSGNGISGVPSGIYVGSSQSASTVAGRGASGNGTGSSSLPASGPRVLAEATPPRVTSSAPRPALQVSDQNTTELEKKIFGDRKFYSMTLNMPNLNSAGGSWVIRFAELHQNQEQGELVAPSATQKIDPAYPLELMRRGVQGTVTLYAVIRDDGSVGEVRVLRGVNDRLDEYARTALAGWHFRPATKNGAAVDLEAVVMIPFKALRTKPGF